MIEIKTKEDYAKFQANLISQADISYKIFQEKLIPGENTLIGIRIPLLKQMAKEISKNSGAFIKYNPHSYYEEKVLHGLVLGYLKIDFNALIKLIEDFLPHNDNWAINDITCANLKIFKKNKKEGFSFIQKLLVSENHLDIRFALVLLLNYYVEENYLNSIFEISNRTTKKEYYVQMAIAWLLSICYIKFPEPTKLFLRDCKLDDFTYNKTISKICDSYRVNPKDKEMLKQMRR